MTETEEEAEVAVVRINLAVSSSLLGSPERPATRSSAKDCVPGLVLITTWVGWSSTYDVHGDEVEDVLYDRLWPLDNTGHHSLPPHVHLVSFTGQLTQHGAVLDTALWTLSWNITSPVPDRILTLVNTE